MFLIDGQHIFGNTRNSLLEGLARLAHAYGTRSAVVFNGTQPANLAYPDVGSDVRVLMARPHSSVHERILQLVQHGAPTRAITVVTDDPALARRVRIRGGKTAAFELLRRALEHVANVEPGFAQAPRGRRAILRNVA